MEEQSHTFVLKTEVVDSAIHIQKEEKHENCRKRKSNGLER